MELKEGYKKTEVGIIPEDWEVTELGSISKVSSGGTPNRGIPSYWNGTIPWITTTLIDFNTINKANEFITEEGLNNSAAKIFNRGDLLMAMYGQGKTRGKVSILGINAATNQACAAISLNKDVVKEYVFCNLSGRYDEIRNLSNTGNQENLSGDLIKKIKIPLPPTLAEQKVIARVLSDTDALIQALENKIDKKKLIKKGAMQKLLTPKEGWKIKSLADIGESIIGLTYSPADVSSAGTLVLRSSNIQGNKLAFEDNVFVNMELPSRVIVKENDLLICVRNGSKNLIGKCALINKKAEGSAFGAFMSVFRSDFAEFVFQVFQSSIIQKQIEEVMGATINQITNKNLASFSIPFPPKQEQIRIAKILSDMDNEIDQLEQKLSKYKELKQGMMQQLLTGKIRLEKFKNNAQEDNLAMAAEPNESYQRKN